MALKITCPHCRRPIRLEEPYPLPGAERQCACGRALAITYPMGMMEHLRQRGARFAEEEVPRAPIPPRAPEGRPPIPEAARGRTLTPAPAPSSLGPPPIPLVTRSEPKGEPRVTRSDPRAEPRIDPRGEPKIDPRGDPRAEPKPPPKPVKRAPRRWTWWRVLGALGLMALLVVLAGGAAVAGVFWHYAQDLPTVETLGSYRPPTVTVVYDAKGELLGEIYEKRRYVTPLDRMPEHLKDAFIAAEDASFYSHDGVDYIGIMRAIGRNALEGRMAQGGSTITQQVARNFLLTNEKKLSRKIREAILSWRIEDAFEKDHILYLYLNQIYLGSGAYGVEAAARVYFGKHVEELTLAEAAILAGLPQRPSDYSPHRHFDKAKARQRYVLDQLVEKGFVPKAEADAAWAEEVKVVERTNEFLLKAPWFTEHIRRYLVDTYGFDKVYNDGLVVESTCDLALQRAAQEAVTEGVEKTDARGGWRGPEAHLEAAQIPAMVEELKAKNENLLEGDRYRGVVTQVAKRHILVDLGGERAIVPLAGTEWAWRSDAGRKQKIDDMAKSFKTGDVIVVEIERRNFRDAPGLKDYKEAGEGPFFAAKLYQAPELQGALFSMRNSDGGVVAMVGGVDFRATEFNRAIQAYRQVGSTFKPIVYAAAISTKRYTAATIIPDAPLVFKTMGAELWKPENYGEDYLGNITLRKALALSRNVVTIRVLDNIKLPIVIETARKVGIQTKMTEDLAIGLGAASLTMPEMTTAYNTFATLGKQVTPHYVNKVTDRDNNVLEQFAAPQWPQALDPQVAGIMNWLLTEVATSGTAAKSQSLGLRVAGKTGTTNDFKDAWFVGYNAELTTSVWVGYDQPRSIGSSATGGNISLPIWMDYMRVAAPKAKDRPIPMPAGLVWAGIDERSGYAVNGGRQMPFLPGTVPTHLDMEAGQMTSQDLLTTEF